MNILSCKVTHTFTHEGDEGSTRHVHVDVSATLDPTDSWDDLADILRDYLLPGLLKPSGSSSVKRARKSARVVTEEEEKRGLEALFEDKPDKVVCPHDGRKFANLHAFEVHIGRAHKELAKEAASHA